MRIAASLWFSLVMTSLVHDCVNPSAPHNETPESSLRLLPSMLPDTCPLLPPNSTNPFDFFFAGAEGLMMLEKMQFDDSIIYVDNTPTVKQALSNVVSNSFWVGNKTVHYAVAPVAWFAYDSVVTPLVVDPLRGVFNYFLGGGISFLDTMFAGVLGEKFFTRIIEGWAFAPVVIFGFIVIFYFARDLDTLALTGIVFFGGNVMSGKQWKDSRFLSKIIILGGMFTAHWLPFTVVILVAFKFGLMYSTFTWVSVVLVAFVIQKLLDNFIIYPIVKILRDANNGTVPAPASSAGAEDEDSEHDLLLLGGTFSNSPSPTSPKQTKKKKKQETASAPSTSASSAPPTSSAESPAPAPPVHGLAKLAMALWSGFTTVIYFLFDPAYSWTCLLATPKELQHAGSSPSSSRITSAESATQTELSSAVLQSAQPSPTAAAQSTPQSTAGVHVDADATTTTTTTTTTSGSSAAAASSAAATAGSSTATASTTTTASEIENENASKEEDHAPEIFVFYTSDDYGYEVFCDWLRMSLISMCISVFSLCTLFLLTIDVCVVPYESPFWAYSEYIVPRQLYSLLWISLATSVTAASLRVVTRASGVDTWNPNVFTWSSWRWFTAALVNVSYAGFFFACPPTIMTWKKAAAEHVFMFGFYMTCGKICGSVCFFEPLRFAAFSGYSALRSIWSPRLASLLIFSILHAATLVIVILRQVRHATSWTAAVQDTLLFQTITHAMTSLFVFAGTSSTYMDIKDNELSTFATASATTSSGVSPALPNRTPSWSTTSVSCSIRPPTATSRPRRSSPTSAKPRFLRASLNNSSMPASSSPAACTRSAAPLSCLQF